ncbi:proline iminopeptidase [Iris pallida]|uniref:Proline iminopeptidase n=1 Tax=Iris pallida TaxID=29817 RepID=A0AAX6E685_IRIPA|nr:proline iminopeptidase [Iris pallida]
MEFDNTRKYRSTSYDAHTPCLDRLCYRIGDEAFHSDVTLSTKPMWSANVEAMAARIWTTWELMTTNFIQNEANVKRFG